MTDQNRSEANDEATRRARGEQRSMLIFAVVAILFILGVMGAGWIFQHPGTTSIDTDISAQSRE